MRRPTDRTFNSFFENKLADTRPSVGILFIGETGMVLKHSFKMVEQLPK